MKKDLDDRLDAAVEIARTAGTRALHHFRNLGDLEVREKGLQDYVTAADQEIEQLIRGTLEARFPQDGFFGEESGGVPADRTWVVDPIDGTSNFLRGLPDFAVSIALVQDGFAELGVVYAPVADHMYVGRRNARSTLNGSPISVRQEPRSSHALVSVGLSPRDDVNEFTEGLAQILGAGCAFRRLGAAAIALCHVAAGRYDAFWQRDPNSWDVLGGLVLVHGAGGTSNHGLEVGALTEKRPILASSEALAPALRTLPIRC